MSLLKFTRTTTKIVASKKLQYFYMKLFTLFIRFVCILLHLQMSYNSDILGINGTYFDKKSTCKLSISNACITPFFCAAFQRGLVMRKLSVCLSVCLSNACIVTKRKEDLSRYLYHTKDHLA